MWKETSLFITLSLLGAAKSDVAVLIGGTIDNILAPSTPSVETYSTNCGIYPSPIPDLPNRRSEHAAAYMDGKIYVCGGYNLLSEDHSCLVLDLMNTDAGWTPIAPMIYGRYKFDLRAVAGKLYAIGGEGFPFSHNDVEIYDPSTDSWSPGPLLSGFREGFCTVAVQDPPSIYILGGIAEFGSRKLVEKLDLSNNKWYRRSDMLFNRTSLSCANYGDSGLIAAGGWSQNPDEVINPTSSLEYYDFETDTWTEMTSMEHTRTEQKMVAFGDRVVVFGGLSGGYLDSYEEFTPSEPFGVEGAWNYGPNRMEVPRSYFGLITLPPDMVDEC